MMQIWVALVSSSIALVQTGYSTPLYSLLSQDGGIKSNWVDALHSRQALDIICKGAKSLVAGKIDTVLQAGQIAQFMEPCSFMMEISSSEWSDTLENP